MGSIQASSLTNHPSRAPPQNIRTWFWIVLAKLIVAQCLRGVRWKAFQETNKINISDQKGSKC
jgi:hypothetical protein